MLWDPSKDKLSLEALIAWLKAKNHEEEYDWRDIGACLCAQYFNVGRDWVSLHEEMYRRTGVRLDGLAVTKPWTFGAALTRARQALACRE